jgi:protein TonB
VEKVSGPDALAPAAIDVVKRWKYRPYELNGSVVEVETTVELKFSD